MLSYGTRCIPASSHPKPLLGIPSFWNFETAVSASPSPKICSVTQFYKLAPRKLNGVGIRVADRAYSVNMSMERDASADVYKSGHSITLGNYSTKLTTMLPPRFVIFDADMQILVVPFLYLYTWFGFLGQQSYSCFGALHFRPNRWT